jgi:hypothetical protein
MEWANTTDVPIVDRPDLPSPVFVARATTHD